MTGRFYLAGVLVKTKCQNQHLHEPHSRGTSDLKHFVPLIERDDKLYSSETNYFYLVFHTHIEAQRP